MEEELLNFFVVHGDIFIYFSICLSLPSILLYLAEIVTILRHKCFHNSFHALFIIRAVPDLLYTFDSYYGTRLPNIFGNLLLNFYQKLPKFCLDLLCFLTNYSFQADNLATVFILLHRFTVIAFPIRHEKLWTKWLLPLAFLVIFGLPLYAIELFKIEGIILVTESNNDGTIKFIISVAENGTTLLQKYIKINTISSVLFLLICIFLNVACLMVYRKSQLPALPGQQNSNSNEAGTVERKLLVYAICTFFGHMLIAILMICTAIFMEHQNMTLLTIFNTQYNWMVDLGTVVLPSWLILWASPNFRQHLCADFIPKCILNRIHRRIHSTVGTNNTAINAKRNTWTEGTK